MRRQVFALVTASVMAVALAACSQGVEDPPAPTGPTATAQATPTTSSNATTAAPSTGASAPASTAAGRDPLNNGGHAEYTWEDYVAAARESSGLSDWPEVERVRFIQPEENATVQAECLTNAGFPTTVQDDGSWTTNSVTDQDEALALATYTCALQYPTDLRFAQAFTKPQWVKIYAYYRDTAVPCLQGKGYTVAGLPSEESFLDAAMSGSAVWDPYAEVDTAGLGPSAVNALTKDCPALPPTAELYGE